MQDGAGDVAGHRGSEEYRGVGDIILGGAAAELDGLGEHVNHVLLIGAR
jgi:hypothetical protein